MINIVEGDLLQATEDVLIQSVNCRGVMGSGLAKQIRKKYPLVYTQYKALCNFKKPDELLGECQLVTCTDGKIVANLFGQRDYGNDGKQYTNTYALQNALFEVLMVAKSFKYSVAIPWQLGSGLGGADWNDVYQIIDDVFKEYQVTIYKFN
jgi:O-acetyl-ADP-ribose deacetylase (regulator of RNase III)